jgi:hypothetical protein
MSLDNLSEWQQTLLICLGVNAFVGILLFEIAYSKIGKRYTDGNEERDSKFPAFRRTDAYKWSRCSFYPGAMLFLPLKLAYLFVQFVIMTLIFKLLTCCHNSKKGPLQNGCRKTVIVFLLRLNARIWLFVCGHFSAR